MKFLLQHIHASNRWCMKGTLLVITFSIFSIMSLTSYRSMMMQYTLESTVQKLDEEEGRDNNLSDTLLDTDTNTNPVFPEEEMDHDIVDEKDIGASLSTTAPKLLSTSTCSASGTTFGTTISTSVSTTTPMEDNTDTADRRKEYEFYMSIHNSTFPVERAGAWVYRPDKELRPSAEHLQCLDQELQGNCHDLDAWKKTTSLPKLARHKSMEKKAIANSPGILAAKDPWVWQSNHSLMAVLDAEGKDFEGMVRTALNNSTIYLVGDSLTRQWSQVIRCELIHVLGIDQKVAKNQIQYVQVHNGVEDRKPILFQLATERDYVVWNIGHHVGWKIGADWEKKYRRKLEDFLAYPFGRIPDEHIFFRTTTVRHYRAGQGDFDTESSMSGNVEPRMCAAWSDYGGSRPEQPTQNQIAFEVFLGNHKLQPRNETAISDRQLQRRSKIQILDISPMMLARGDATFDGCHFCLPGPMEYWSRMLYHRLYRSQSATSGN